MLASGWLQHLNKLLGNMDITHLESSFFFTVAMTLFEVCM